MKSAMPMESGRGDEQRDDRGPDGAEHERPHPRPEVGGVVGQLAGLREQGGDALHDQEERDRSEHREDERAGDDGAGGENAVAEAGLRLRPDGAYGSGGHSCHSFVTAQLVIWLSLSGGEDAPLGLGVTPRPSGTVIT